MSRSVLSPLTARRRRIYPRQHIASNTRPSSPSPTAATTTTTTTTNTSTTTTTPRRRRATAAAAAAAAAARTAVPSDDVAPNPQAATPSPSLSSLLPSISSPSAAALANSARNNDNDNENDNGNIINLTAEVHSHHNHHFTVVSPSRISSSHPSTATITSRPSVRTTIPSPPCCFDEFSTTMTPKPTGQRAHRSTSVYSTPSSARPSRHPSSLHRFGRFNPTSRRAFHALFSRRLRTRTTGDSNNTYQSQHHHPHHHLNHSNSSGNNISKENNDKNNNSSSINVSNYSTTAALDPRATEERLKILTDENARLRARVIELMSRLLCGATDGSLTAVATSGDGGGGDPFFRSDEHEVDSKLRTSFLPSRKGTSSAPPVVRVAATTDSGGEISPPPSRAPSDGVTFPNNPTSVEERLRAEAEALRASLKHATKENESLKKSLADLEKKSKGQLRTVEEEKDELEERLSNAREDRELMENELCELREWSRRNLAQKEAVMEAVKREFADTRNEVKRLNELVENMRRTRSRSVDDTFDLTARLGLQEEEEEEGDNRQLLVQSELVIEEDIVSPDRSERTTIIAEGEHAKVAQNDDTEIDQSDVAHEQAADSHVSVVLIEENKNDESETETEPIPSNEAVGSSTLVDEQATVREEDRFASKEEEDDDDNEGGLSNKEETRVDVNDNRKEGEPSQALLERAQTVEIDENGGVEREMDDMSDGKFKENALGNPLMKVEREQIIVGHFCGHVVQTVGQLVGGSVEVRTKEEQVKDLIAQQWEKWVSGSISKVELIEALVEWVRGCCDKGADTNVVQSFNAWYVAQYTQYKTRKSPDHVSNGKLEGGGGGGGGALRMRRNVSKTEDKSSSQTSEGGGSHNGREIEHRRLKPEGRHSGLKLTDDQARRNRESEEGRGEVVQTGGARAWTRAGGRATLRKGGRKTMRTGRRSELELEVAPDVGADEVVDATAEELGTSGVRVSVEVRR